MIMNAETMITAHNGADHTPESTMEYVRYVLDSRADAMEIDIRRYQDGTLIFSHDTHGAIGTMPFPLVTIRSVFDALRGTDKLVNCDLKEAGLEDDVWHLACECGVRDQLIYTGTVSASHCVRKGLHRHVRIALNIEEYVQDLYERCLNDPGQSAACAEEMCEVCRAYDIPRINANYRLATDDFIKVLERNRIDLSVWTVNEPSQIDRFLSLGVYNLTTRNLTYALSK